jgi:hypothetical protein
MPQTNTDAKAAKRKIEKLRQYSAKKSANKEVKVNE